MTVFMKMVEKQVQSSKTRTVRITGNEEWQSFTGQHENVLWVHMQLHRYSITTVPFDFW